MSIYNRTPFAETLTCKQMCKPGFWSGLWCCLKDIFMEFDAIWAMVKWYGILILNRIQPFLLCKF